MLPTNKLPQNHKKNTIRIFLTCDPHKNSITIQFRRFSNRLIPGSTISINHPRPRTNLRRSAVLLHFLAMFLLLFHVGIVIVLVVFEDLFFVIEMCELTLLVEMCVLKLYLKCVW